jgi:translation initiation factor IF-3
MEKHISEPRINDRIRVPEVRLVGPNGEQVGIVRVEDALRLAAEADLDLVEVAPMAKPPVAKLMDFGKYKYEAAMKAREARKNQVNTVIKEIKLRPKIDPHDYGTKKGHVERFLKGGDKVKVTIMFRGREQSRPELGFRLLQRLAEDVLELGTVESAPKQDGRNMVMVIAPTKKKAQAMAEQRRKRDGSAAGQHAEHDPVDLGTEFDAAADLEAEGYAPETPEVEAIEVETPEVEAIEVETPEVEAIEVETPEVEAIEVETPEVEAPAAEAPEVEAPEVEAPEVKAPAAKATKAPAPAAKATKAPARPKPPA